jgi:4-amino-4-deoxy-L-arabinose transferase-like glycosyltransferase
MKITTILILSFILFFLNLGEISLWDPDEPRQATMAREMMDRGDYIHPYLNGKPYLEKPPLYPWAIIIASKIRGTLDETSSRLPSAIAATLLVLATFYLGRMLADPLTGFFSALVLMTNFQFLSNAREAVMDMTFAFFIGLTIVVGYYGIVRAKRWVLSVAFLSAAMAILSKGPAGLLIPAVILFIYSVVRKETKRLFLPLAAGCFLCLAVASVWFLLAGDAYIKEFILRQNITRYTDAFDHRESFLYYFPKIFFNFLPWSILLPFAFYHAARRKMWLPLIWFAFVFLFFQFSLSKRAIYLLSLYPAAALLCGSFLRDRGGWLTENARTRIPVMAFAAIVTALPLALAAFLESAYGSEPVLAALKTNNPHFGPVLAGLAVIGALLFWSVKRKAIVWSALFLFIYVAAAGHVYNACYMTAMDRSLKSPKQLTAAISDLKGDKEVYTYGFTSPGFIFYTGKPIHQIANLRAIKHDKRDIIIVVEDQGWTAKFRKELEKDFAPVRQARYEKEKYTIYTFVERHGR